MVYPALLPLIRTNWLPVVDWTEAPADLMDSSLSSENEIRGLLEKYPTFGREKETGLLGALDT